MPLFSYRSGGLVLIPVLLLGLLSACDNAPQNSQETPAPASEGETAKAPSPGPVTGSEALPPGHPPFEGMTPAAPPPPMPTDAAAMPAGHPPMPGVGQQPAAEGEAPAHPVPSDKELAINLPESVMGKWSAVTFEVTAVDGSKDTLEVALGSETSVPGSNLMLRAEVFVPAYKSDFKTITSASNALDNPAAKVALIENQQVVAKGWVFQNLPEFNSFSSDKVSVRLLSAVEAGSPSDSQGLKQ